MKQSIQHTGVVTEVLQNRVNVTIDSEAACASCHARGVCGTSEHEAKTIEVLTPLSVQYDIGEKVVVSIDSSLGMRAVFMAYVFPFIVVLGLLLALLQSGIGELAAGLAVLGALAVYYLVLFLLRHKISREFTFGVEKASR